MNDIAIRVQNLSKCYHIYDKPHDRLKQFVIPKLCRFIPALNRLFPTTHSPLSTSQGSPTPHSPLPTPQGVPTFHKEFWALKDVSFEIKKGETVGIIGRNGSGKSTLLQLICGTLNPTGGNIQTNGRIAALLELGSGFNPEFTGRENIYLNCTVLGLSHEEIESRYDRIVEFADIGEFIDQPVKTYSSGMFVRLAFAVQANIDASIVIIDEALAVGDIFFRQKCYARLEQLRNSGAAILLVSHSMPDIEQYCERAILLDRGVPRFIGSSSEAAKHYYLLHQTVTDAEINHMAMLAAPPVSFQGASVIDRPPPEAFIDLTNKAQIGNGQARCVSVAICNDAGQPCVSFRQGEQAFFFYEFELDDVDGVPICGMTISNEQRVIVHGKSSLQYSADMPVIAGKKYKVTCHQVISLNILPGEYVFQVGLSCLSEAAWRARDSLGHEEITSLERRLCHLSGVGSFMVGMSIKNSKTFLHHHGIADLPGKIDVTVEALWN